MRININNSIRARLTKYGDKILEDFYKKESEEIGHDLMSLIPNKDDDGYQEFQLWVFMNIFGNKMYNGAPNIIANNEIIF